MATKEPGWAEMFLPLQALDIASVTIDEPKKSSGPGVPAYAQERPLAALSYKSDMFTMPILSILTSFLKVYAWDSKTGRLDLEIDPASPSAMKLSLLQDTIVGLLIKHPQWLRVQGITKDDLKTCFQHILNGSILTIYLHGPNQDTKPVGRVWVCNKGWQKGASASSFQKGQLIRVALRLQGVCFLQSPNAKTRLRVQHQTVTIFHKPISDLTT
jgi:hypothetical protein